jgi:hypothetical protein
VIDHSQQFRIPSFDEFINLPDSTKNFLLSNVGLTSREFNLSAHFSREQTAKFYKIWTDPTIRMMHYTGEEKLINIAEGRSIWLKNARKMNDPYEMKFGMEGLQEFLASDLAELLWGLLDDYCQNVSDEIKHYIGGHYESLVDDTYIFCLTEVNPLAPDGKYNLYENYGEVAVVIDPKPMGMISNLLGANSYPVIYRHKSQVLPMINGIIQRIVDQPEMLEGLSREEIIGYMWSVIEQVVYGTKVSTAVDDEEWRIVFTPKVRKTSVMEYLSTDETKTDFDVYALPLRDYPDQGVTGLDIDKLVKRIIIQKGDGSPKIRANITDAMSRLDLGLDPAIVEEIEILGVNK